MRKDNSAPATGPTLTASEAASVTGVPLKRVHRFLDTGLLPHQANGAGRRTLGRDALVALKLAHETADVITLQGRRRLVRYLLDHPGARTARDHGISVDVLQMKDEVQRGLAMLRRARSAVESNERVLAGTPCFRRTRVPVHVVADMLANGDAPEELVEDYPRLTVDQINLAPIYAVAYPNRGRRRDSRSRSPKPISTKTIPFDDILHTR